ncbi:MAG: peptidoglycan DD-metalloendopeptidase family protein [Gammaproteobacteria bacterium]|nr:peptidoglycan DD-metalloendopeptidase family protein [Gammaproteobacteria bacterium]
MTNIYLRLPRRHQQLLIAISVVMGILLLFPSDNASASRAQTSADSLKVATRYPAAISLADTSNTQDVITTTPQSPIATQKQPEDIAQVVPQPELSWQQVKVKSGDNLALIFNRAGFSANTLYKITSLGKDTAVLKKIMPGQTIHFGANKNKELIQLTYQQDRVTSLEITKVDGAFQAKKTLRTYDINERIISATIKSNFWNAAVDSKLDPAIIMNLANIFEWDIDFSLDIREGDQFSLIYETMFLDGEEIKTGNILAAEFINRGQSYKAIRAANGEYYSDKGRSMRKAFLRSPVKFNYISSSFNPRRRHPVTKLVRPHNGIDYAARTGTRVRASGSGTVIASSYTKFNGNYVVIKHGERYVTKYLHLSKKFVRKGARVKQGQHIGNVGATGRVTGAHLHYEFLVNGVHRNPRTVKLPKSQSIAKKDKPKFLLLASQRIEQLATNQRIMLASN